MSVNQILVSMASVLISLIHSNVSVTQDGQENSVMTVIFYFFTAAHYYE